MICYIAVGKLFHTRGPATAKLLSPRVVRVRGTARKQQAERGLCNGAVSVCPSVCLSHSPVAAVCS